MPRPRCRIPLAALALALGWTLVLVGGSSPVAAQVMQRIVAVVNDEVISDYDLEQRLKLVLVSTRLPDNRETRRRLGPQILATLINERLQLQEAARLKITVSDADLDRAKRVLERRNQMREGALDKFLESNGIATDTLAQQIRAEIAWSRVVARRYRNAINVGDDEVDAALARIRATAGQTERLVAEIFLAVDTPNRENEVRRAAQRLVDQIRRGASFAALARQFSQGATAAAGGDVGWVQPGQLPAEVESALERLNPGEISAPIRSVGGFYIVLLRDRRKIMGADPDAVRVALKQIVLPLSASASAASVTKRMALAENLRQRIRSCDDVEPLAKELDSPMSGSLGTLRLADLPVDFRKVVADLPVGRAGPPVRTGVGLHVLVVCERIEPPAKLPTREDIRRAIGDRRFAMMARRYLRDLRRDALVEVR